MTLNWKGIFLWSNQFYGICAVLLTIESNLLLLHKMPNIILLLFIHLSTVVYYTHAYLQEVHGGIYDERSKWYQNNRKYLVIRQLMYTSICIWIGCIKFDLLKIFSQSSLWMQLIICISIFISVIYYLPTFPFRSLKSIRDKGLLKSLSISWVWSIVCCVFPIWFELRENLTHLLSTYIFWNHFIFLFFFILVLAILFDIKDLYRDKNELVNTIVARHGIDFTIHKIIVPLLVFIFSFAIIGYITHTNSMAQLIMNMVLLCLTYLVTRKIINFHSIHINLLLIDGLIMLKALLSIFLWNFTI